MSLASYNEAFNNCSWLESPEVGTCGTGCATAVSGNAFSFSNTETHTALLEILPQNCRLQVSGHLHFCGIFSKNFEGLNAFESILKVFESILKAFTTF